MYICISKLKQTLKKQNIMRNFKLTFKTKTGVILSVEQIKATSKANAEVVANRLVQHFTPLTKHCAELVNQYGLTYSLN